MLLGSYQEHSISFVTLCRNPCFSFIAKALDGTRWDNIDLESAGRLATDSGADAGRTRANFGSGHVL